MPGPSLTKSGHDDVVFWLNHFGNCPIIACCAYRLLFSQARKAVVSGARHLIAARHRSAPSQRSWWNRLLSGALTRQKNGTGEKPAVRPKGHAA